VARIEGQVVIGRPAAEVFDFVADERNEPKYNPRVLGVRKTSPGPPGAGATYEARARAAGRPVTMTIRTTGYERPKRLDSVTTMAAMDVRGTLTFEPVPGGTRLSWSWGIVPRGWLRPLTRVLTRIGDRRERASWDALKRFLEGGAGGSVTGGGERPAGPPARRAGGHGQGRPVSGASRTEQAGT